MEKFLNFNAKKELFRKVTRRKFSLKSLVKTKRGFHLRQFRSIQLKILRGKVRTFFNMIEKIKKEKPPQSTRNQSEINQKN